LKILSPINPILSKFLNLIKMKNTILILVFVTIASVLMAQAPQAINYQAIARNSAGNPVISAPLGVRFRILQGSATGIAVYAETYATTTNAVGLFNLIIGRGAVQSGVFANITWENGTFYLEVAIDPAGGTAYQVVGIAPQMLSVPYALYAGRGPKSSIICDDDADTWVKTQTSNYFNPNGDADEIHMSLGKSHGSLPGTGVAGPTVLILRENGVQSAIGSINPNPNTMLELFDPTRGANTFIGEKAGESNTTTVSTNAGVNNTAIGLGALNENKVGTSNTAVGVEALRRNKATGNTAIGVSALISNSTGAYNTATGLSALFYNDGNYNTSAGHNSMFFYTKGNNNTANGASALRGDPNQLNNTGSDNTAIGINALFLNSKGDKNTALGANALYNNKNNSRSTAIGYNAMLNADDRATGRETFNTALGHEALLGSATPANNIGQYNTAIGDQTLWSNTSGNSNTASGQRALYKNLTGSNNTANGAEALRDNIIGQNNTANGIWALHQNTGDFNTGLGAFALEKNTTGFQNTAIGNGALNDNILGIRNTATGASALKLNTATDNTATGAAALEMNLAGTNNTATGVFALNKNIKGGFNTANGGEALANNQGNENAAIGFRALNTNTNGSTNSALGAFADVSIGTLTNATAIGAGAIADASNQIRLGNRGVNEVLPGRNCAPGVGVKLGNNLWQWQEVWACNGMIQPSDSRLKTNISTINYGLSAVMAIRPVQYFWKTSPNNGHMLGFIAQEIEKIIPESVVAPKNEGEYYAMKYDALIPVLTKAIQEQQAQIEDLKKQNAQLGLLNQQNQSLQTQLNTLRADVQSIRAALEKQPITTVSNR
jgi:trimeric autotransporter adhesin